MVERTENERGVELSSVESAQIERISLNHPHKWKLRALEGNSRAGEQAVREINERNPVSTACGLEGISAGPASDVAHVAGAWKILFNQPECASILDLLE